MEETPSNLNDSAVKLASEGAHNEAIACLRKGLLIDPENGVLWFNLALSYRALGNREAAREALIRAAEDIPNDTDVFDTLGVVLHELGDDAGAERCYDRALDIDPGNGRVWNNFGVLLFGSERFTEARSAFEKSLTLIPDFDDALYNLRDTYEELGRFDEMRTCAAILDRRENGSGESNRRS